MLGLFQRKPKETAKFEVKFLPDNTTLTIDQGSNLLEAALRQGVVAPYNCRVGACKTCQIQVLEGRPKSLMEREYVFSQKEIEAGTYLACQTSVQSDMVVVWSGVEANSSVKLVARLLDARQLTPRIYQIRLKLDSPLSWRAGQFARLLPSELAIQPRSYSMVAGGTQADIVEFHITHYPDGELSSWIVNPANIGKPISVEGPFGDFGLDEITAERRPPLLCVAGGSGLGAIGGMIGSCFHRPADASAAQPILLVYGARDQGEVYAIDALKRQAEAAGVPFSAHVVLDREPAGSAWSGRRGFVAEHLADILAVTAKDDARFALPESAWHVLLCGPTPLVDSAIAALRQTGIHPDQMSFDKYEQGVAATTAAVI
ncbi:2Fe-2S iron-sulfur cluster-binding protein [Jeongeupia wiesaeckerbachi]|uniref:2Fe-2S iron-sulfur cluster-binding protein n=1 Tax=Jeongeupia wiesaeckerbachi TaxID=3051218 RepID=UPI003D801BE3